MSKENVLGVARLDSSVYKITGATVEDVIPACRMMWESYLNIKDLVNEDYFACYQTCDPYFEPELLRILWVNGRIAATVRLFMRELWDGSAYRLMAGIGNLATHPDFRGKGLSVPVLEESMCFAKEKGAVFSTLYTAHIGLLAKVGFRTYDRITLEGDVPGAESALPLGSDLSRAKTLYDKSISHLPGALRRSEEYWNMWIEGFMLREAGLAYSNAGDAYVIYGRDEIDGCINILDGGYDENPAAFGGLVRSAFAGRRIRLRDIDQSHVLVTAVKPVLINIQSECQTGFMVSQLADIPLPSHFCETYVDHF